MEAARAEENGTRERGSGPPTSRNRLVSLGIILAAMAIVLFAVPRPEAIQPEGWRLLAIFVGTVVALMLNPIAGSAAVLLAITATMATGTLSPGEALSGYSNPTVWLVLAAFFIARSLLKTGLARRIALNFVRRIGHTSLGLAYSIVFSDVVLATIIPSNTARSGGVLLPITRSLAEIYHSRPGASSGLLGTYLMLALYQGDVIACAMFLTGQASNPLGAELATQIAHVPVDWARWLWAALLPGLVSLALVPWVIFRLAKPGIVRTPAATEFARKELQDMGPRSRQENIVLVIFFFVCSLWITSSFHSLTTTTVALLGVSVLLVSGILTWQDALEEQAAWDVFIWYGGLFAMAGALNDFGVTAEFARLVSSLFTGWSWLWVLLLIGLIFFYAHYGFASITAHMVSMYPPFLGVLLLLGTPPGVAAFLLLFFANLNAGLTHYGTIPAPIVFGVGYVSQGLWWKVGFLVSLVNITIWLVVGMAWWKIIGLW
ncbi:MAG: DASS family sodium-coupled anion symporter [Acidobacteria bacterium]|nr:DASS family sodium-coupled anion symporter [Acidobacteriota bacterium]